MVQFEVYGVPVPQGSKNVYRGRLVEAQGPRLKLWREEIKTAASYAFFSEPLLGPIKLEVTFWLPRGKTVKRPLPSVTPDGDKLLRAVGDALTGTIYKDDQQITDYIVRKRYADDRMPGASITVTEL